MLGNFFRELAIDGQDGQRETINYLTYKAPIVALTPFQESSHPTFNKYEVVDEADAAGLVDFNSPLPKLDATSNFVQTDLQVLGGTYECTKDAHNTMGGKEKYIYNKVKENLPMTGMKVEKSIIYDNWIPSCIKWNKDPKIDEDRLQSAGGTGSTNYSIVAVRYAPGCVTGLYNPAAGGGFDMKFEWLNNEAPHKNAKGVTVYEADMTAYVGYQIANPKHVSAIVNIDLKNSKTPTQEQITNLVMNVEGTPTDTFLYMHPKMYAFLTTIKKDLTKTEVTTKDLNFTFDAWDGIPIVTSFNFKNGTEPKITI